MRLVKNIVAGAVIAAFAGTSPALADFPERPIRVIVGYVAGGSADYAARLVAEGMSKELGQPVIIENKPGASGAVGAETVVRAAADGYTLLLGTGTLAIDRTLRPKLPFNVEDDLVPVAQITESPFVVVVRDDFPATTLGEYIDHIKANPGAMKYGSPGVNTTTHLATALFGSEAGLEWTQVAYGGEAASLTALMGGEVGTSFISTSTAKPQLDAGTVRGLAITGPSRSPLLPDIQTVEELGFPNAGSIFWYGFFAPKGTPEDVVEKINAAIQVSVASPAVIESLSQRGFSIATGSSAEFTDFVKEEVGKWAAVAEAGNLQPQD